MLSRLVCRRNRGANGSKKAASSGSASGEALGTLFIFMLHSTTETNKVVLESLLLQLFECIVGYPPGCVRIHLFDRVRPVQRHSTKMAIAFPDLPQGPAHRFLHKIALIGCILFDQWEKGQERLVRCSLVMNRQFSHQHKTRPPYKLLLPVTPLHSLLIGIGGFIEEISTDLIANVPRIKIVDPLLHMLRGNKARVSDHGGKDSCLMDARTPQL